MKKQHVVQDLRRYSGPASAPFWNRINELPRRDKDVLVSCGILLQNMEEDVLKWLDSAEADARAARADARRNATSSARSAGKATVKKR